MKKEMASTISVALFVMVLYSGLALAEERLNLVEGYWDTFVTIRVQGGILPVPAIKSSKCLTLQDPLPNSTKKTGMNCQIFDKASAGNDVSWRVECADDKGRMEGQGKITYAGTTFEGGMDMSVQEIGGDRHLTMHYVMHGERVGTCDARQHQ
jgi:hypothetical protein